MMTMVTTMKKIVAMVINMMMKMIMMMMMTTMKMMTMTMMMMSVNGEEMVTRQRLHSDFLPPSSSLSLLGQIS